ncbi:hypothetical protein Moror_14433 [Moniliophthora roreri MCA 2997]|uniref:Reverse transcriptase-rnase h-integrase n=1 Tax=Moniliophthora roreri (strain MCA 2997) TaxID=1381753 RepID=V2WL25_MONRO|nr:hypothetical protein Moror_14433 [Moniliophthora roreri MCA 2997]
MISGIGDEDMILGLPWLRHHNPQIDWEMGEVKFMLKRKIQIRRFQGVLDNNSVEVLIGAKITASQELAHQQQEVKKEIDELIPAYLQGYRDCFKKKKVERFPLSQSYDHAIELKLDFVPRNCKLYPLSPNEQKEQDKFLEENLRKGYIRKSKSPMASPFFFVVKKEKGALQPTQDYRELNKETIKNAYPLPLISELLDKLKGARVFMKLDLRNGYNNVQIKNGDQWKAAFKTNRGLFEPTVMFFGLSNSPATFQAFMNDILSDFIDKGWCVVYMDDVLLFSQDQKEHQERTERLMWQIRKHDLYFKPEKYRDPRFVAEVFQEMGKQLSIKHSMSMAFHPQTDEETKRVNQEIEVYLHIFCAKEQTKWKEYLPLAEFTHNNRTHSVLKNSPFFMMMGYHPRAIPTVFEQTDIPSVDERLQELKRIREETTGLLELARQRMLRREKRDLQTYNVGQKVWLEGKNLTIGYPSKKLAPKREGPFEILEALGPVTYQLKLLHQWKIHPVFHAALLTPFKETEAHRSSFMEPPPDLIEEFEEYEVEAIIGH